MPDFTAKGVPFARGDDPNDLTLHTEGLADWVDAHPGVSMLTTAQRDALTGAELWADRLILNLTTLQLERYDADAGVWRLAAVSGDDARLTNPRVPTGDAGGALMGTYPNPALKDGAVTSSKVAAALKDPAAAIAGLRTLGAGAQQAAPGDHAHGGVHEVAVFTASGTWSKPAGAARILVQLWAGGGGGGANSAGGGGGYIVREFAAADLGATVPVTIGAGGSAQSAGGTSSFGTHSSVTGGGPGGSGAAGGAGGGTTGGRTTGAGSVFGGGAGGSYNSGAEYPGGRSVYGGGGGAYGSGAAGTSDHGGRGGGSGVGANGAAPAGGGAAGPAGAGARGEARITTYFD